MKKYSAFTLIEMLIVMGIIIILMAAGVAGGRFAIQRANKIQKQNAVDNIEQALWGYYGDNRSFPGDDTSVPTPLQLLTPAGALDEYIDAGQFDGGGDGTFWYFVGENSQLFVVCASFGGVNDDTQLGIYCSGNGLDELSAGTVDFVQVKDNVYEAEGAGATIWESLTEGAGNKSTWNGDTRSF